MQKYGDYQADPPDGGITWFKTGEDIAAGAYIKGHGTVPNVYITDSVAALIMRTGNAIDAAEQAGQAGRTFSGMDDAAVRTNMASQLTDELIARLTNEDDPIWENAPHWLKHLRSAA